MRPRVIMVLAIVTVLIGGVMLVPAAYARLAGDDRKVDRTPRATTPEPTTAPAPGLAAAPVSVPFGGSHLAWALMNRATGEIAGSKNLTATNSTESMIKVWIVSDYLRRLGDKALPAARKKQASTAIRDSNDDSASALYNAGGKTAVTKRMIDMCGLTETRISTRPGYVGWWSFTEMSARDAVRLGDCVADGTAAGPKWTEWVLDEMSKVRGSTAARDQQLKQGGGRWGIIDGLPDAIEKQGRVSIKNGWTPLYYDSNWHVNCLAVTDTWSLAVMMRYPISRGLDYGAKVCASVTTQLVTPQPGAALKVPPPLTTKAKL